jgi:hypothetical protein
MVAVAVCALLLAPVVWLVRERALVQTERLLALDLAERARAEAERARYVATVQAAEAALKTQAGGPSTGSETGSHATASGDGLWAALGVNRPVFLEGEVDDLSLAFTLVNDGDAVVDPEVGASRIVVNGKELDDSRLILGNGPQDARFAALPPGDHLLFARALGDHFREPGVYRVSWRGARSRAPEVVFRVLPGKAR